MAVAADARVRRLPRRVAGQERVDDARPELRPQIQREVRQPHPVRDRAREPHRVGRAAGRRGVVLDVAPELQRDRDGVLARPAAPRPRSPRRRSSRRACAPTSGTDADARSGAQRAVQRVGGQIGRVQLAGREPAELRRRSRACPRARRPAAARRRPASRPPSPAAVSAPQPEASNAGLDHAVAVDPHRDADQIAAQRARRRRRHAPGKHDAAPIGRGEVFFEALAVHDRRVYDRRLSRAVGEAGLVEAAVELRDVACGRAMSDGRRAGEVVALLPVLTALPSAVAARSSVMTTVSQLAPSAPRHLAGAASAGDRAAVAADAMAQRAVQRGDRGLLAADRRHETSGSTRSS